MASKGCVVNLMVFSLAKHLQLWVELPAEKEDHMENKLVKCMWLAAACKPSLKSWYPMSWTQTLMYLHGFSSQLAKTWLSIWDLASLSGRRHCLKNVLFVTSMVANYGQETMFATHWSTPGLCTSWCQRLFLFYCWVELAKIAPWLEP